MKHAVGRRIFCCAPKLCQMLSKEEYGEDLLPSNAYLIMSTAFQIPHELFVFHHCECLEHAAFNNVNWTKTGFYPRKFAEKFATGLRKLFSDRKIDKIRGFVAFEPSEEPKILKYNPYRFEQCPAAV